MNHERFGGSLVAPYQTPGEPPQTTEPVIAPEDRRFGGSLVAPYTGNEPPEAEPVPFIDTVIVTKENRELKAERAVELTAEVPEENVAVEDISDALMTEVGTDLAELLDDENLPDVDDEHQPEEPKLFHHKGKRRR